ncbi:hypothetical protein MNBD_NITROSPINAE02-2012 [hydrothermal vent metagenome]|uniref:Uncharacterized protein n=1 Tax=hydrothermal vent metagenome TaxID=652676 RepID=A0A3B1CKW3_9ZZZZ
MKKFAYIPIAVTLLAGSVIFGGLPAWATPSTQIWIPSTDTQPYGTVHLGVDNYTTVFRKSEDGAYDLPTTFGITAGVAETEILGLEIGVDLREPSDDPIYMNAKLQINEDSVFEFFPAIAIGIYDAGTNGEQTDYNIMYFLVAKNFPALGRFSAGYYYGNEDLLKDANGESNNTGILASWDRTLAEVDERLWLAVDYMGGNNSYGALSFGFAWRFSPNISALLGYDVFNDKLVAGENALTVQFDMDF